VPADRSSPIPAATDPAHAPLAVGDCPGLLERLAMLPDPRDRRGRRHTLASVLAVSAAAVLAGARSVTAIAEWAADAPGPILAALGVRRDPLIHRCHVPGEATIRRVLARVDGDRFDRAIGAWLADRLRPPGHRRVIAVDGKRLRGSARQGHQVHLLAATVPGQERAGRPCPGWSGAAWRRGQVLAGQGEEGAPGRRAGGGPPHQQQAAVELGLGEAQPDQLVVTF
jgi:DDE_Tnp_1-associated